MIFLVIRTDMKRWAQYHKELAERFMPAAMRGVRAAGAHVVALMHQRTRTAPPANPGGVGSGGAVNTGYYLRSWKSQDVAGGVRVYNAAPYAGVIEHGRRKGAPPPKKAIVAWLRRRLGMSQVDALSAAWPVARAIGRRGLKGRKVLGGAKKETADIAMAEIERELMAEVNRR